MNAREIGQTVLVLTVIGAGLIGAWRACCYAIDAICSVTKRGRG